MVSTVTPQQEGFFAATDFIRQRHFCVEFACSPCVCVGPPSVLTLVSHRMQLLIESLTRRNLSCVHAATARLLMIFVLCFHFDVVTKLCLWSDSRKSLCFGPRHPSRQDKMLAVNVSASHQYVHICTNTYKLAPVDILKETSRQFQDEMNVFDEHLQPCLWQPKQVF